jgi:hypothetical protein
MSQEQEAREAFDSACGHDSRGEEATAIPEYERALALGLPPEQRCSALLGLGSSLRNVGRLEDSVRVLRAAVAEFPDHAALRAFLAISLHTHGDGREALVTLLDVAIRYAPIGQYARSLGEYRDLLARPPVAAEGWDGLVGSLTRKEFVQTFPFPFLLEIGGRLRASAAHVNDEETEVGKRMEAVDDGPPLAPHDEPFILPVRKVATAVPSSVTLGRANSNDVIIRDSFISKVQAFFRSSEGRWEVSDAGSRNGTWVASKRLDGKGEAVPIGNGDILTFGRVAFFFLSAGGLWDRLRSPKAYPQDR